MSTPVIAILERLVTAKVVSREELVGLVAEELRDLTATLRVPLPAAYREFLQVMGTSAGVFLAGTDCFHRHLPQLRAWAEELLRESGSDFFLEPRHLVFAMHQGYELLFLDTAAGDDPPVWRYREGDAQPEQHRASFSAYLAEQVELYVANRELYGAQPPIDGR